MIAVASLSATPHIERAHSAMKKKKKKKNRTFGKQSEIEYSMENCREIHQPRRTFMHLNFTKGILPWVPVHENTDAAVLVSILLRFSLMNSSALVL